MMLFFESSPQLSLNHKLLPVPVQVLAEALGLAAQAARVARAPNQNDEWISADRFFPGLTLAYLRMTLMGIFENAVLHTHKVLCGVAHADFGPSDFAAQEITSTDQVRCVQFLWFYIASLRPNWAEARLCCAILALVN